MTLGRTTTAPDKREAILAAALGLFVEKGFHGTAVPEIAARAGVGAGTIYRYFENKEAVVNALYQELKGSVLTHVMTEFPFSAPPREQFHVFWSRMAAFARENPKELAFLEFHHHQSYMDTQSAGIEDAVFSASRMIVGQWRAAQVAKDIDVDLLMAVIWGAFTGIHKACWQKHLTLDDNAIAAAEACVWEAIRR